MLISILGMAHKSVVSYQDYKVVNVATVPRSIRNVQAAAG